MAYYYKFNYNRTTFRQYYFVLTRRLGLGLGVVGLLELGVVGRVELGVTDLLERDPDRKSGNRYGETVLLSDL